MINIDRGIGLGLGAGLTLLSFSGLKCINSMSNSSSNLCSMSNSGGANNTGCPPNVECMPRSKTCSKTNMNLGLGSLMISGILMTYKHMRN